MTFLRAQVFPKRPSDKAWYILTLLSLTLVALSACSSPTYNYEQSQQRATAFYYTHQDSLSALVALYQQRPAYYLGLDDDMMTLWQYDPMHDSAIRKLSDVPLNAPGAQAAFRQLQWSPPHVHRLQTLMTGVRATHVRLIPDAKMTATMAVEIRCLVDPGLWVKYKVLDRVLTAEDSVWFTTYLQGRHLGGMVAPGAIWYF